MRHATPLRDRPYLSPWTPSLQARTRAAQPLDIEAALDEEVGMAPEVWLICSLLLAGGWAWMHYCRWQDRRAEHDLRDWLASLEADRQRRLRELREAREAERWLVRERPR
jgi:hypothetical protein